MKIHVIMHEHFESPGAYQMWAEQRGYEMCFTTLYEGQALPEKVDEFDFLLVMGGPQSPATTSKECPYFNAGAEIALIQKAIVANKIVVGVCLGAQLLGEAYGANFEHSPHREIGVFPVKLTEAGKCDPVFGVFPDTFLSGHWHGDMPGISPKAEILAYSEGCPRQIVRFGKKVYALQCHLEFNQPTIEAMITNCAHELKAAYDKPFIQDAETLRQQNYQLMNNHLFQFLDQLVKL